MHLRAAGLEATQGAGSPSLDLQANWIEGSARMRRRQFLIGLSAVPAGWGIWLLSRNRFVVKNETGQQVRSLTVEVCDRTFSFGNLTPGGSVSARFGTPDDESDFLVRYWLEDGTRVEDRCGYVVWENHGHGFLIL